MNKHKDNDWEKLLSSLTNETKETNTMTKAVNLLNGLLALALLNGLTALLLMFANKIVNRAWEGLTAFTPAIGYADAFWLCGLIWLAVIIKMAVVSAFSSGQEE